MNDTLERLAEDAWSHWTDFVGRSGCGPILAPLEPQASAIGVKVGSKSSLWTFVKNWSSDQGDLAYYGSADERGIATIRKAEPFGPGALRYVKILERRPGSTDSLGLEHLEVLLTFRTPFGGTELSRLDFMFKQLDITCELEPNEAPTRLSIRWVTHDGHPFWFKLVNHEVWTVCMAEMQAVLSEQNSHASQPQGGNH